MSSEVKYTNESIEMKVNGDSLIESLIAEENELLKKIKKSRDNNDFGLYKNLVRALTDVTCLKQRELDRLPKETWKDMYSHYKLKIDNEFQEVVSTWQQKGDDFRKHKVYKIEKEITNEFEKAGMAFKTINAKLQEREAKNTIESIIDRKIDENESIYDVLKSLSNEWDKFTEEGKREISNSIVGLESENCFNALMNNLDK
jgi:hypothetical protein